MPFNIGPGELIILADFALILYGPKKLPEFGKALGESIGAFKKALNGPAEPPAQPQPAQPSIPAVAENNAQATDTAENAEQKPN